MAKPSLPTRRILANANAAPAMEVVSGNLGALTASAAIARTVKGPRVAPAGERTVLAKPWQIEVYRHLNICGEAQASVRLFANMAARAEIGISEPQALGRKAVWVDTGPEVDVLAELAPDVRARKKLVRDYMTHFVAAGECYLIARDKLPTDPSYAVDPRSPVWEIVAVTEIRKLGTDRWQVRHDNQQWIDLPVGDPVIRMWNPDPEDRREAWSPMRALLPTLREIEYLTKHIFTQVRSRLMTSGVWGLPSNMTFPEPPPDEVEGGAEAIAAMNEAERFMVSLAISSSKMLDGDDVAFPTIVMADSEALEQFSQDKLIKFWSEIDDKAMVLRSDAVRRFALGFDLPPEQILGSSGLAVTGAGGSAGSVNHWGVWANEETTISNHVEPALDTFVYTLTVAVVQVAIDGTDKIVAYDTATLRGRQDRSKESMELYDRGWLKGEVMVRENGFDPANDIMSGEERREWLLMKIAMGSATPEMVAAANALLGLELPVPEAPSAPALEPAPGRPGTGEPPSLEDHPYEGPPREQHDHSPAPFGALHASCEALVLRALEKAGARLLNQGKRGRDRDRETPPHLAHLSASVTTLPEFDFTMLPMVLGDRSAVDQARIGGALLRYCNEMYAEGVGYSREGLMNALKGL